MQAQEPLSFVVGSLVEWKKYLPNYKIADYSLFYSFRSGRSAFNVAGIFKHDHFLIRIPSLISASFKVGTYWWQASIAANNSDDWQVIGEGSIEVKANLALTKNYDGRSHVRLVLDALEATILGKASLDQLSYSIAGRSLSRLTPLEILKWRDLYKAEYARELQQEQLNKGLSCNNLIKVRF